MSGKSDVRHTLTNRDVEQLSKAALKAEWSETFEQIAAGVAENIDKAWDRRHELWQEMRARTDADPPKCPECAETAGWSQELGGPKECNACGWMPSDENLALVEEIDSYWQSVQAIDSTQSQAETQEDN